MDNKNKNEKAHSTNSKVAYSYPQPLLWRLLNQTKIINNGTE